MDPLPHHSSPNGNGARPARADRQLDSVLSGPLLSVLLPRFASAVSLLSVAVPVIVPAGTLLPTRTTTWNVAISPVVRVAMVAVSVPPGGVARVAPGPAVCVNETKVVLAGTGMLSRTFRASWPVLPTVMR